MENYEQTQNKVSLQTMIIPLAIIVAGALIAGGIYMSGTNASNQGAGVINAFDSGGKKANIVVEPITSADHVLGDPKTAKVNI